MDREVYVATADLAGIARWLAGPLGPLVDAGVQGIYRAGGTAVTLTPGVGGFTSVYVAGAALPWASDVALAREAARALGVEARCDPGVPVPPSVFLRIVGDEEALVDWIVDEG